VSGDPCMRLLGVPRTSSPRHLLGLPAGELSVVEIEAALLKRSSNAQGRDKQASEVRRILRQAAKELLASLRKPAQRPRPMHGPRAPETAVLTDFDQDVLAVLIGCGGWNAQTRTRLVSLAAAYGVSVQGLHKVMTGLSERADIRVLGHDPAGLDRLIEAARIEADPIARVRLYQEAERLVIEDVAWIPLYFPVTHLVIAPGIEGFVNPPMTIPRLRFVEITR